ncbi:DUF4145 domain-containing protein [Simiduia agarivorans]|uniref:DUF4145 domain-containing protein n=1 Tax=Simiduia agarivorans (strain DSM 21679 / JCM 13881 / BCRC 17597 / SA1) TaxID=1117647 RepID=K4KP80_SIMAS|nr:DUF4145 domain-containing protein [Simiduia agarivorans]AFU99923.1 hypothetical protein M5M_13925 [Simiduia agarivorans SA1 = DSM 21679]
MKIIAGFVTLLFLGLATGHLFVDGFAVDSVAIVLLVLAVLPWLLPYLKSLELPGGIIIELKDVKEAIDKVASNGEVEAATAPQNIDPQLALVALRIDIERLIRSYQTDIGNKNSSLSIRVQVLANEGVLSQEVAAGILEIIRLGNAAAHGAEVDRDAAEFVLFKSNTIIRQLEAQLKNA